MSLRSAVRFLVLSACCAALAVAASTPVDLPPVDTTLRLDAPSPASPSAIPAGAAWVPFTRQAPAGTAAAGADRFHAWLDVEPSRLERAFLVYETRGLSASSTARRSLNGGAPLGGFAATAGDRPVEHVEEIHPLWLRHGDNVLRFLPLAEQARRPSPAGAAADVRALGGLAEGETALDHAVGEVRLAVVVDSARPLVRGAGRAPSPSALAARLLDGRLASGWGGEDDPVAAVPSSVDLPFAHAARAESLDFEIRGEPAGELWLEVLLDNGGAVVASPPVDLAPLGTGRHTVGLDPALPAGVGLRLSWRPDAGNAGSIVEVDVRAARPPGGGEVPGLTWSPPRAMAGGVRLSGFVRPLTAPAPELFVDGAHVAGGVGADGAFELLLAPAPAARLELVYADGRRFEHRVELPVRPAAGGDDETAATPRLEVARRAVPDATTSLRLDAVRLDVAAGAVERPVELTLRGLAAFELPALDLGMTNVTAGVRGVRMGPAGMRFAKPVELSLGYDPELLPAGMGADDVRTYFFDEEAGRWYPVPRLRVDEGERLLVSTTDHFTDFINATLEVPDHPEGDALQPNSLLSMLEADPAARIDLVEPPMANPNGDARLAYPLWVPPGRHGLQPTMEVVYSSGGGNGWLGVGWDLALPSVEVSTLFGVPRYDAGRETESYLLDGAFLAPSSRGGDYGPRRAERVFTHRVEGTFLRVVRHGATPAEHWWEVTDKQGVRHLYGQSEAARLRDPRPPHATFRWLLERTVDLDGNSVDYAYGLDSSIDGEPWVQVYPKTIRYTGVHGAGAYYEVRFLLDGGERPDRLSTGRPGFKVYTRRRLARVDVLAGGQPVRSYRFDYRDGEFGKSLLDAIVVLGAAGGGVGGDGEEFYRHDFDYVPMARLDGDAGVYDGFSGEQAWGEIGSSDGSSDQWSVSGGAHAFVGLGPPGCEPLHGGIQAGASYGESTLTLGFVDVNGDGLPDRLRDDGRVELNSYRAGDDAGGFTSVDFSGATALGHTREFSFDFGSGLHAIGDVAQLGVTWVWSHANEDRAIADVNGDGRPDLVSSGGGFQARINTGTGFDAGQPWQGFSLDGLDLVPDGQQEEVLGAFHLSDPLRKLALPYDGRVRIAGAVQKREAGGDGVVVSIHRNGGRIWRRDVAGDDVAACVPSAGNGCGGGLELDVSAGDRLYFLANSRFDTAADALLWAPRVTYLGRSAEELADREPHGAPVWVFDAGDDFRLAGPPGGGWQATADGSVRVLGGLVKQPTADDVRWAVRRNGAEVAGGLLSAASSGSFAGVGAIDVDTGDRLTFEVWSDTQVDPLRARWTPTVTYVGGSYCRRPLDGGAAVCGAVSCLGDDCTMSGDPTPEVPILADDITRAAAVGFAVDASTAQGEATVPWRAPEDGTFEFDLEWSRRTRVLVLVQGEHRLIDKREVERDASDEAEKWSVSATLAKDEAVYFTVVSDDKLRSDDLTVSEDDDDDLPVLRRRRRGHEDVLSGGYHGWFYGEWNGDLEFHESGLDEESDAFAAALPRWQGAEGFAEAAWTAAGFDLYLAAEGVKPSRLGFNAAADLDDANGGGGGSGLSLLRKSSGRTHGVSASAGAGFSLSLGSTDSQLDLMDMNGDGYADQVGSGGVRHSNGRDGFGGLLPVDGLGSAVRRFEDGNLSVSVGLGIHFTKKNGKGESKAVVSTLPSVGTGTSLSQARSDLVDVNGDGLPDRVDMQPGDGTMRVRLNLGYRFGATEHWAVAAWQPSAVSRCREPVDFVSSEVLDLIGGLDDPNALSLTSSAAYEAGLAIGPFGGGAATTLSRTVVELVDVNGDGLVDHVSKDDGESFFRVKLNRGDHWAGEELWHAPSWNASLGDGYNPLGVFQCLDAVELSGNVNGHGSVGLPICIPLIPVVTVAGLKIEISGQVSGGAGGMQLSFQDLDGDGLADHVLKKAGDRTVYVKRNQAGQVNLLRRVERPLGGAFELTYRRQGNRVDLGDPGHLVDLPQNLYALAAVSVDDGQGHDYRTSFDYGNDGYHDRGERVFYGFARVVETRPDRATVERRYHNQDFYLRNLLREVVLADADGRLFRKETFDYATVAVAAGAAFPALARTETHHYEGTTADEAAAGKVTAATYEWDALGNLVRMTDFGDSGSGDDRTETYGYHVDPSTYVLQPDLLTVRGGDGELLRERRGEYDARGHLVRLEHTLIGGGRPDGGGSYAGSDNAVWAMGYDAVGNLASLTEPSGLARTYAWDAAAQTHPVEVRDSFGYVSRMSYDLRWGEMSGAVDVAGNATRQAYDDFGRPTALWGPYDLASGPTLAVDYGHGARPAWALVHHRDVTRPDPLDQVVFVDGLRRPVERKEDIEIDTGNGSRVGMQVSGRVEFDALGRVAAEGQPVFDDGPPTAYLGAVLRNPVRLEHDVLDRVVRVGFPQGVEKRFAYGFADLDGVTRLATEHVDPNGRSTLTLSSVRDELLAVVRSNTIAGTRRQIVTRYRYDAVSQLTAVTDTRGNESRLDYDSLGNLVRRDHPDNGVTEFRYDPASDLVVEIPAVLAANGSEIRYDYTFGRLDRIDYPVTPDVVYSWGGPGAAHNRAGRPARVEDESGAEELYYGKLGEVVRRDKTAVTLNGSSPDGPYVSRFVYDSFHRLLAMTYPDGEELRYGFDAGGRVVSAVGTLAGVRYEYLTHAGYDEFGDRVRTVYGNGVETRVEYDPRSRLMRRLATEAPGRELQDLRYGHDAAGVLTALDNRVPVPRPPLYGGPATQSFAYDDLYQLVAAEGSYSHAPEKTSRYSLRIAYDELGNVTAKRQHHEAVQPGGPAIEQKKTSFDWTYDYAGPRPQAATRIGERAFLHDEEGNQAGWDHLANGTRQRIAWDERSRVEAVADNGQTTRFLYDADGMRTNKAGPHGETVYVDRHFSVRNGTLGTKHVYADDVRLASKLAQPSLQAGGGNGNGQGKGNGGGKPVEDKLYFFHPDHLGSTQFVTDGDGEVYEHLEYFPSGELWVDERAESQRTPYLFSAKELDEETGLSYFGARYYEARLGRWLSVDPLFDALFDTDRLAGPDRGLGPFRPVGQVYGYVANAPLDLVDADGRDWWSRYLMKMTSSQLTSSPLFQVFARRMSTRIPGGGLRAHEAEGGHTIERHVGRSVDQLRARLDEQPRLTRASSFPDLATAERAAEEVVTAHGEELSRVTGRTVIEHETSQQGTMVERGRTGSQLTRRVRMVVDSHPTLKYLIKTFFPSK